MSGCVSLPCSTKQPRRSYDHQPNPQATQETTHPPASTSLTVSSTDNPLNPKPPKQAALSAAPAQRCPAPPKTPVSPSYAPCLPATAQKPPCIHACVASPSRTPPSTTTAKKIPHSGPDRGSASGGIIQTPRHHRHGLCPSRPVSTLIRSGGGGGPCPSDPDPRTRSLPAGVMRRSVRSVGQFGIYVHAHPPPLMGDGFGKCGGPGGGSMVQSWRQG